MPVAVELFDSIEAAARDAGGALDRAAQPCLFDRLDWFRLTLDHCPARGRPLIVRARDGDRQAWLFLRRDGAGAEALASWYTLRFDAIGNTDHDLLRAIGGALAACGVGMVDLYPVLDDARLRAVFARAGWRLLTDEASGAWRIATEGMSFADYWAARPSRLRNTVERKAKAAELDIAVHTRFDEAAWSDYEAVYRASWKPAEGSTAFLRALAEQESAAGTLRLGIARAGGRPVAAQLWLVEGRHATIHKLAYADDAKALSPGTLLSAAMFRHALDVDRVAAIDFGLGDDRYKRDWMAKCRPVQRLTAYRLTSTTGLAGLGRAAAAMLVRRLRRR